MTKKITRTGILAVMVALLLSFPTQAAQTGTIYVDYSYESVGIAIAPWQLYQLATLTGDHYEPTPDYDELGLDYLTDYGVWEEYKGTFANHIDRLGLLPDYYGTTDDRGKAVIEGLPGGVYLLRFDSVMQGGNTYTSTSPILLTIPGSSATSGEWTQSIMPKVSMTEGTLDPTKSLVLMKVWRGDTGTTARPDSITVNLYRNAQLYEQVVLDESNSWTYGWTDMPTSVTWAVEEDVVPVGYVVRYDQEVWGFIIENTYGEDSELGSGLGVGGGAGAENDDYDKDVESGLAETGALVWPIPVLAAVGVSCIGIGLLLRKEKQ